MEPSDPSLTPEESDWEDSCSKEFLIQDQLVKLPKDLAEVDLSDVLSVRVWSEMLTEAERTELLKLLPETGVNQTLEDLFTRQIFHFANPVQQFSRLLQKGSFSRTSAVQRSRLLSLSEDRLHHYSSGMIKCLEDSHSHNAPLLCSNWRRRRLSHLRFSSDSSSEESIISVHFSGSSSGETTQGDEEGYCENTERKGRLEDIEKELELKRVGNLDWVKYSARFKDLNIHKNQLTIKMSSIQWIESYRKQESERYKHPTLPWAYQLEDGTASIVAPVCRKVTAAGVKAREHLYLKSDRPPYITLLSITRDAAARLPDGIGTRADICQLVRDSQFIVETISDSNISSLVSGALDRLHYEKDPCVKFDIELKLWIYLHRQRGLDYSGWRQETQVKRGRPPIHKQETHVSEYMPVYLQDDEVRKIRKLL
jgi:hypothetical protein